jgi:hypothetical protein
MNNDKIAVKKLIATMLWDKYSVWWGYGRAVDRQKFEEAIHEALTQDARGTLLAEVKRIKVEYNKASNPEPFDLNNVLDALIAFAEKSTPHPDRFEELVKRLEEEKGWKPAMCPTDDSVIWKSTVHRIIKEVKEMK